jgi:hypothetical protein
MDFDAHDRKQQPPAMNIIFGYRYCIPTAGLSFLMIAFLSVYLVTYYMAFRDIFFAKSSEREEIKLHISSQLRREVKKQNK